MLNRTRLGALGLQIAIVGTVVGIDTSNRAVAAEADKSSIGIKGQIGIGVAGVPDYEGSNDYRAAPLPIISLSYRDVVFLSGIGIGARVLRFGRKGELQVSAGPILSYRGRRDQDDNDALSGLGDVDASLEAGGFLDIHWQGLRASVSARHDLIDGHGGTVMNLGVGYEHRVTERFGLSVGLSSTWASSPYMKSYFGISAGQAARSGYAPFRAGAGFKDAGVRLGANYKLHGNLVLTGSAGYKRLLGDAARSPIVKTAGSAHQFTVGLGLAYRFKF